MEGHILLWRISASHSTLYRMQSELCIGIVLLSKEGIISLLFNCLIDPPAGDSVGALSNSGQFIKTVFLCSLFVFNRVDLLGTDPTLILETSIPAPFTVYKLVYKFEFYVKIFLYQFLIKDYKIRLGM